MYLSVNKVAFVVIRSESAIVAPTSQFITMLVSVQGRRHGGAVPPGMDGAPPDEST